MPMDVGVSSTWGGFWGDLYTKLASLTGWSVVDDSGNLGTDNEFTGRGQWWVLELPSGENVRFEASYGVDIQYGPAWDATDSQWTERYGNDPLNSGYDGLGPNYNPDEYNGSEVTYTLRYGADEGFVFYVHGVSFSDNRGNTACAFGLAELDRIWAYSTGDEAAYSYLWQGGDDPQRFDILAGGGSGTNPATMFGNCRVHAKTDLTTVPLAHPNVVASGKYGGTLTGTHDLWLEARAGFSNGDIIEDSAGVQRYQVFVDDSYGSSVDNPADSIAIKMD